MIIVHRCPTGEFTQIPLHASGIYPGGVCCADYYVSSYTSTLTTLLKLQKFCSQPPPLSMAKVVLAAVPQAAYSQATYIHGTTMEIDAIYDQLCSAEHPLLDDSSKVVRLHGAESMALQGELKDTFILHLASHGVQMKGDPLRSGFLMADKMLTVEDLMKLSLPNAFLAILSACQTARGDARQKDQGVHLAATMQFTGFKSVIATMWYVCPIFRLRLRTNLPHRSMQDSVGIAIAKTLYQHLYVDPLKPLKPETVAFALDKAVEELRTSAPGEDMLPSIWPPFVHIGL